jgi:hypothetical protein
MEVSNIRNPILVSYVAKGLLPYHGLGSGIARALDAWPQIDFIDDRDGLSLYCYCSAEGDRRAHTDRRTIENVGEKVGENSEQFEARQNSNHTGFGKVDWRNRAFHRKKYPQIAGPGPTSTNRPGQKWLLGSG